MLLKYVISAAQTSETPGDDGLYHGWKNDKFIFESPVLSGEYWITCFLLIVLFCVNRLQSFPGVYVCVYRWL